MTKTAVVIVSFVAIAAARSAMLAAPGQSTARPGEILPARVWIENRNRNEAIPVSIEGLTDFAKPLRVEVVGTPVVSLVPTTVVQARFVRQPWEHRTMTVAAGQDLTVALMQAGNDGWEAVSSQLSPSGAAIVLLKRPR